MIEVTIDVVELPTLDDLRAYNVEMMRVRVHGPAGGNPCLTLKFKSRGDAVGFLTEWYGADPTGETAEPPAYYIDNKDRNPNV